VAPATRSPRAATRASTTKIAGYPATGALPARKPGRTADVEGAPLPLPTPPTAAKTANAVAATQGMVAGRFAG